MLKFHSLGIGGVADTRYRPLPYMCYCVKFGTFASKGVCIHKGTPKIEDSLETASMG